MFQDGPMLKNESHHEPVNTEIDDDIDESPFCQDTFVKCPGRPPNIKCDTVFNLSEHNRCPVCYFNISLCQNLDTIIVPPELTQHKPKKNLGNSEFRASLNKFSSKNGEPEELWATTNHKPTILASTPNPFG